MMILFLAADTTLQVPNGLVLGIGLPVILNV